MQEPPDDLATLTGAPVLATERLWLRRWRADDRDALLAVYGDADAMRWVGDGVPLSAAEADAWLAVTAANYRRRGYGMFAVDLRATGETIGFCGLVHPGGQSEAEVKYAYARAHWGHGHASEAVAALVDHAHAAFALDETIATVAPANAASRAVLAKAGFREERVRRNDDGSETVVLRRRLG